MTHQGVYAFIAKLALRQIQCHFQGQNKTGSGLHHSPGKKGEFRHYAEIRSSTEREGICGTGHRILIIAHNKTEQTDGQFYFMPFSSCRSLLDSLVIPLTTSLS
jgi:hypothetical protein